MISDPTKLPFNREPIDEKCFAASGLKSRSTVGSGAEGLTLSVEKEGRPRKVSETFLLSSRTGPVPWVRK